MYRVSNEFKEAVKAQVRNIYAEVDLYDIEAYKADKEVKPIATYKPSDRLISFTVERSGDESKFFGFGICQKINVKLIDTKRELNISTKNFLDVRYIHTTGEEATPYPKFFVTEVHRDENTNELSITAYDILYNANKVKLKDVVYLDDYITLPDRINCIFLSLGDPYIGRGFNSEHRYWWDMVYDESLGFEPDTPVKEILDKAAEVMGCVYYVNFNAVVFRQYNYLENFGYYIGKEELTPDNYYTLKSGTNRKLTTIASVTELGDNISVTTGASGTTQYLRDNNLIANRADIDTFLNDILTDMGNFTINQFECEWRGNPLLEPLDSFFITTKDGNIVRSYLINDKITYDGTFKETSSWNFIDNDEETETTPATIGDTIKQTYARVDKANKQIALMASKVDENNTKVSQLLLDTEAISASVTDTNNTIDTLTGELNTVIKDVSAKMTSEEVSIAINTAMSNGANSVSTSTGYTFNSDGLNITKTGSEISTLINEDGMRVSKNNEEVLTADNTGVNAINLTARQYLIVGSKSRFEDYGERTGCFWIGG